MAETAAGGKCPICRRPTVHEFRPFCSRRCADIDLARWLKGSYAIPGNPLDPEQAPTRENGGEDNGGSGRKH